MTCVTPITSPGSLLCRSSRLWQCKELSGALHAVLSVGYTLLTCGATLTSRQNPPVLVLAQGLQPLHQHMSPHWQPACLVNRQEKPGHLLLLNHSAGLCGNRPDLSHCNCLVNLWRSNPEYKQHRKYGRPELCKAGQMQLTQDQIKQFHHDGDFAGNSQLLKVVQP